jgi:ion channel-forming bestrophin family protein
MHSGKRYSVREFIYWTRRDIYKLLLLAIVPTVLFFMGWRFLALTWVPIALLGTAVAFIIGFKNNASYARLWEARQVYGSIINASRAYGVMVRDFLKAENGSVIRHLFHLHFAWLTALRYQLREPRNWETMSEQYNVEYLQRNYHVPHLWKLNWPTTWMRRKEATS